MWEIAQHCKKTGEITPQATFNSLDEAITNLQESDDFETYYVWVGEWPEDHEEYHALLDKELEINEGKCLRIMPGVDITLEKNSTLRCRCSGRCFCVRYSNNRCVCEAVYRGRWYRCPGSC